MSTDRLQAVRSGKTPYVRFDLNDYSIPHTFVRWPLVLIASPTTVRLTTSDGCEVARHDRSYDRGKIIEDPQHIADLARIKRHAHGLQTRDRLRIVCPTADRFIDELARRDAVLSSETRRLSALLDRYGAENLDAAMADALDRGAASATAVEYVLDQWARRRGQRPPIDIVLPDDDRIRDVHVVPHDLTAYDDLDKEDDDDDQ